MYLFTSQSPLSNGVQSASEYYAQRLIIWSKTDTVAAFYALRHYLENLCHGVLNLGLYSGLMNFGSKVLIIFESYKFIMVHN